jgi:predicted porin
MHRKLLAAAAVASAFATPAFAQVPAEIQIYGRINVTAERIETEGSTTVPNQSNYELIDNSSRIGIRGNKELTPGLKAIWQVESNVNVTDGGNVFSSRDSFVGLQGAFGTMRAGRTIGPVYYATYDYISMHNHDTGTSSDALLAGTVVGNAGFMNNTLWYTSPKIGAITIDAAFSLLGETRQNPTMEQPRHIGLVASFDQGPLHAAISYANTKNDLDLDPTAGTRASDATAFTIGGAYDFRFLVLGALWEMAERDTVTSSIDSDYFRIAAMFPMGQHEFHVNYGWVDGDGGADAKQWTLGYNFNITKTTKVYAFYTTVDNESGANFGFNTNTTAQSFGAQQSSIAVGVRHNF